MHVYAHLHVVAAPAGGRGLATTRGRLLLLVAAAAAAVGEAQRLEVEAERGAVVRGVPVVGVVQRGDAPDPAAAWPAAATAGARPVAAGSGGRFVLAGPYKVKRKGIN